MQVAIHFLFSTLPSNVDWGLTGTAALSGGEKLSDAGWFSYACDIGIGAASLVVVGLLKLL